ncbi:uncharacterized protein LOC121509820 [Cheilinus undulatus]|uniref:uncharacterized protein LOC121509820 n=1 Tax=Cheilinus undulatus TaxID=241271 RepID=UPI001BD1C7A6|nr:uncharacterized protein LOC121509820 [Cheilinus undulatus]
MNPPIINSTNFVSTTRKKREAERSVNWTAEETHVLLCAWSDERVQKSLAENLRNRHVFKHLSARMSEMGFFRSPHQCRLRVKTLKASYMRTRLQRSVDSSQPCTFKYFREMDAVLGRRSAGGEGETSLISPDGMGQYHQSSFTCTGSTPPNLKPHEEASGHQLGSSGRTGSHCSSSAGDHGGRQSWQIVSEVKVEHGEVSTDEFEFSKPGCPQQERDEDYPESSTLQDMTGPLMENSLTSSPPHEAPPPLPPSPPVQSASLSPPAPPHPNSVPISNHRHPESSCLEPVLRHLSDCFQGLVSETRDLLVQLESQRQEQARWNQELLVQWMQREERWQREAAEREERREKARMEHEIRVLQLLTGLDRRHRCRCEGGRTAAEEALDHSRDGDGD